MRIFASLNKRRVIMTCGVVGIALLCGQVMQAIGENPLDRINHSKAKSLPADPAASNLQRPLKMPGRVKADLVSKVQVVAKTEATCNPQLMLDRAPGAMIGLTFIGCKEQTVLISHGGVQVVTKTNAAGKLQKTIPALEETARVVISFEGETIESTIKVPDAIMYERVAIVWSGAQTLKMHAFEFGAKRHQFGHVWAGAPKSPKRATRGSGGFLTQLGDGSGASAEVYSFPAGQSQTQGVVRLVVEAEVTPFNCGKQINAVALQSGVLGGIDTTEVALKMPQCDGIGQVVRLQNLFQDMRLAMR